MHPTIYISQALFAKTFMHAVFHSLRAGSDGLGEVGGISSEMHVTPAERSEPGVMTTLPPSRSRASKMHESVLTSSQVEVEKYYPSLARFASPGSTISWTL